MANEFKIKHGFISSGDGVVDGKLGIGTASPSSTLDVSGNILISGGDNQISFYEGSQAGYRLYRNSTTMVLRSDGSIREDAGSRYHVNTNGSERLRVDSNGNVGIGTTNPIAKLHALGENSQSATGVIHISTSGTELRLGGNATYSWIQSHSSKPLYINELGNNLILNLFGGNVGIGTASPDEKLRVNGNIKAAGNFVGSAIQLGFAGTATITTYDSNEDLLINPNGSGNILMQTTLGNVGIGTTSPSEKLHVEGNAFIKNNLHVEGDLTIGKISNDSALVDVGGNFNFDTVAEVNTTDAVNFVATILNVAGNINNGSHTYTIIYKTADGGETGAYNSSIFKTITILDNATAGQVELTGIPVSTDARVVARDIYRSSANDSPYYGKKLATLNDNTTTTYVDNLPDSALDQNTLFYRKANTTAGVFYINNKVVMQAPNAHRTSLGVDALKDNTIGQDNVAIGGYSLSAVTNGKQNTAVGYSTGSHSIDGENNTFIGYSNGYFNDSGNWNTYVGSFAGRNAINTTNHYNTGIGGYALTGLTLNNSWNTALGYEAGKSFQGAWNIHIGYQSGSKSTGTPTGNFNINLGAYSGRETTGGNNVVIGYGIEVPTPSNDNQLNIGNLIYGTGLGYGTNAATGNIGIGTTSPLYKLDVSGEAKADAYRIDLSATTQRALSSTGTDSLQVGDAGVNDIKFKNAAGTSFILNSSGNVGIGTTAPSAKLEVYTSGSTLTNNIKFGDSSVGYLAAGNTGVYLSDKNGVGAIMFRHDTRYVGIGTTSPAAPLHVVGNILSQSGRVYTDALQGYSGNTITLGDGSTALNLISRSSQAIGITGGNVGIGTTSPSQKLDVVGNILASGDLYSTAIRTVDNNPIKLIPGGTGNLYFGNAGKGMNVYHYSNVTLGEYASYTWNASGYSLSTPGSLSLNGASALYLKTAGSFRLAISSTGNVGIGTTAPANKLTVNQSTDSNGIRVYGHDDRSSSFLDIYVDAGGNSRINEINPGSSGYLAIVAQNYLSLSAASLVYTESNFRIYDTGMLSLGSSGDYKLKYDNVNDVLNIHTDDNKGISISSTGTLQLNAYGAGILKTDSSGNVSLDTSTYATQTYVTDAIADLVDSAPATLDTLNELAAALGDDPNFATTVTNSISTKLPLAGGTLTGDLTISKTTPILTFNSSDVLVDQGIVFSNQGNFDASIKHGASSADMIFDIGRNSTWGGAAIFKLDTYQSYRMFRDSHQWSVLGSEKMRVASNGNVGIGTTAPSSLLHVNGSFKATNQAVFESYIDVASTIFQRQNIRVLNKAGTNWVTWATRDTSGSESKIIFTNVGGDISQFTNDAGYITSAEAGIDQATADTRYVNVTGDTVTGNIKFNDNVRLDLGASSDLQLYHNGADSVIQNENGHLFIQNTSDDKDVIFRSDNGSGGVTEYFAVDGSIGYNKFSKSALFLDNVQATFGGGTDLRIYHDGSNSYIDQAGTGKLILNTLSTGINIQAGSGETRFTKFGQNSEVKVDDATQTNKIVLKSIGNSYFNGGNVGIGTTTPNQGLHVKDSGAIVSEFESSNNSISTIEVTNSSGNSSYFGTTGTSLTLGAGTYDSNDLVITTAGNVGIGTTIPNTNLHIAGPNQDASEATVRIGGVPSYGNSVSRLELAENLSGADMSYGFSLTADGASTNNLLIRNHSNNIAGNVAISVDRISGNVGIGTASPSNTLDVNGGAEINGETYIRSASNVGLRIQTTDQGIGGADGLRVGLNATHAFVWQYENKPLAFATNGGQRMTISAAGNVGIGTTSPAHKLQVEGDGRVTDRLIVGSTSEDYGTLTVYSANAERPLGIRRNGGAGDFIRFNVDSLIQGVISSNGGGLSFNGGSTQNYTQLFLNNDGTNVGIGTTNPAAKLEVAGSTITSDLLITPVPNQTFTRGVGDTHSQIYINPVRGNRSLSIVTEQIAQGEDIDGTVLDIFYTNTGAGNDLLFRNGGTNTMVLKANNKVGIGTLNPGYDLQVIGDASISTWLYVNNIYPTSSTNDILINTGAGRTITINPTSTGKTVIPNGNVGIGTTSPTAALHVQKAINGGFAGTIYNTQATGGFGLSVRGGNSSAEDALRVQNVGGTYLLNVKGNGNVGIGTTSPSYKLDVNGEGRITGMTFTASGATRAISTHSSAGQLQLNGGTSATTGAYINIAGDSYSTGDYVEIIAGRTYFTGNVGIGTASPSYPFSLESATTGLISRIYNTNADGQGLLIRAGATSSATRVFQAASSNDTKIMTVNSNGNVGIGTVNPVGRLEVVTTDANRYIRFKAPNGEERFQFYTGGTGNPATQHMYNADGTSKNVQIAAGGTSYFNGGNVGIGTTSPLVKLDVNGTVRAGGKTTYTKAYASLSTTGNAVAGLGTSGNGASARLVFEIHGGSGEYQRVVYSCYNASGNWYPKKVIDEGTNAFDVTDSGNAPTVTFTFKARTDSQAYTPYVTIEHVGAAIDTQYL